MLMNEAFHPMTRVILELWLLFLALVVTALYPGVVTLGLESLMAGVRRLSRSSGRAVALVGLLGGLSAAFGGLVARFPQPMIHDEFSYLLAADTFAAGRWANPPHPMWQFFETYYVIQDPTYASQYPPGPGLLLAFGQIVFGHPAFGVWIGAGLACAAITWMLLAWTPRHWAFIGGILAASRIGFMGHWGQVYFATTIAVTGGALMFGAIRRLYRRARTIDAGILCLGLALLAHSRPFEGLVTSIPVMAALATRPFLLQAPARRRWLVRVALPIAVLCILLLCSVGAYNYAVTGDPLRLPYQEYEDTYSYLPIILLFEPTEPPDYRHSVMAVFYKHLLSAYDEYSRKHFISVKSNELIALVIFLLGGVPLLAMLFSPHRYRDRWLIFASIAMIVGLAAVMIQRQGWPRKAAPIACLIFLLAVRHLRVLDLHRRRGICGRTLARLTPVIALAVAVLSLIPVGYADLTPIQIYRPQILQNLHEKGGRHLVVVRYAPQHDPNEEWVYNSANIDGSDVVWAREMSPDENRVLFDYFEDRTVWLLEPDHFPIRIEPYSPLD